MRILVISAFSLRMNTSATLQNLIVIDGLTRLGHRVDVLTTKLEESHVAYDPSISLEQIDHYYELRLPAAYASMRHQKQQNPLVRNLKKTVRSIYNELEVYDGYRHAVKDLDSVEFEDLRYDCILSFSDPKSSHLIARAFIEKYSLQRIPWIQYWGDPMYIDISRSKKKLFEGRVKKAESELMKMAAKIIYATPFTAQVQQKLYPKFRDKITYATQGYWEEYACLSQPENESFTLGYFGNYSPRLRNIGPLCQAMEALPQAELLIGGNGMRLESTDNIQVLGFLNHSQIRDYENRCDLLVCLLNSSGTQIPGKLYYYASFRKPILVVVDGEYGADIREFLAGFYRYLFCENTPESIAAAVRAVQSGSATCCAPSPQQLEPAYIAGRIMEGIQ